MTRLLTIAALLAAFGLGYVASGFEADEDIGCPIYAVRIKNGKREQWLTYAQWNIYRTPHGDVQVGWDGVNDTLRIIGTDLQSLHVVGNVIDIDVLPQDEEL